MRIQDQLNHAHLNDENLAFYRAIGVDDLTIYPPPFGHHGDLTTRAEMADYLKQVRKQAGKQAGKQASKQASKKASK